MKNIRKNVLNMKKFLTFIVIIAVCFTSYFFDFEEKSKADITETNAVVDINNLEEALKIHYINIGQADAILIQQNNKAMLIDSGEYETRETVNEYLKRQNISKIDYVVATHPHADHIGAMSSIIDNFDIGKVLISKKTHTTNVYKRFLESINRKNIEKVIPQVGDKFDFGKANFEIVGPTYTSDYNDNTNNYSLVLKLTYGNNTFLFTGDAEELSENDILKSNVDLKCDVLKVGHHGSDTSTSDSFLKAISPKYAVICVGEDNKYGLPKKSTIEKLNNNGIKIYRTDENGTIIAISDGNNISFQKEK